MVRIFAGNTTLTVYLLLLAYRQEIQAKQAEAQQEKKKKKGKKSKKEK